MAYAQQSLLKVCKSDHQDSIQEAYADPLAQPLLGQDLMKPKATRTRTAYIRKCSQASSLKACTELFAPMAPQAQRLKWPSFSLSRFAVGRGDVQNKSMKSGSGLLKDSKGELAWESEVV